MAGRKRARIILGTPPGVRVKDQLRQEPDLIEQRWRQGGADVFASEVKRQAAQQEQPREKVRALGQLVRGARSYKDALAAVSALGGSASGGASGGGKTGGGDADGEKRRRGRPKKQTAGNRRDTGAGSARTGEARTGPKTTASAPGPSAGPPPTAEPRATPAEAPPPRPQRRDDIAVAAEKRKATPQAFGDPSKVETRRNPGNVKVF